MSHPPHTRGSFEGLPAEEAYPGVLRRSFSSEQATVTAYRFGPDARFPLHRHPEEQILLVEEGQVEFTVDGERERLRAGDWSIVGPNVEHGLRAGPEGARLLAVLVPRRQRSDAYTLTEEG